ncbi:hypothetical protein NDU88_005747 [Pleurodeles waltl]|uniref:Uncharacterized protein n=1 Tax=Pleurodeles waltl TaxID=8319 RepID=A0AAV7ULY7_PLEWA|nr:hypothetical protein NDU88_005747 [Pleurodeles waltl]
METKPTAVLLGDRSCRRSKSDGHLRGPCRGVISAGRKQNRGCGSTYGSARLQIGASGQGLGLPDSQRTSHLDEQLGRTAARANQVPWDPSGEMRS